MRAVLFESPGHIHITDLPIPVPAQDEVRLRVTRAGICSTDFHIFQGHFPIQAPRVLGHELVGIVDRVGPGITTAWEGKTCGVSPARFCGRCTACRQGFPELCLQFECLGNTHNGGFAEYTCVRGEQLVPVAPSQLDAAVWLEPLACVMHALEASQATRKETILILGAGVLGRLMVMALRATTQARIAVVDPHMEKIQHALEIGAQAGWSVAHSGPTPEADEGLACWAAEGPQVIIDTTGSTGAIRNGLNWVAPGGILLLFGVSDPQACLSIPPSILFHKEAHIQATSGMTPQSFEAAKQLLLSEQLDLSTLEGAEIDLGEVPDIFQDRSFSNFGKPIIRFGGGI